jgi:predicted NUDIX family NTP pyrophosphohydrolase
MRRSAGLLLYRRRAGGVEVLLVHPGGPFFARKDAGAWTIPKGEVAPGETALACARREFEEETGACIDDGEFVALPAIRQAGGKEVVAFAVEADFDAAALRSNTFTIEWPRSSGRFATFPEVDRAEWMTLERAAGRMHPAQAAWLPAIAALAAL